MQKNKPLKFEDLSRQDISVLSHFVMSKDVMREILEKGRLQS